MSVEQVWPTEKSMNGNAKQMTASTEPLDPEAASRDQLCGIGSWRPSCLQSMANSRAYVVVYIIIGIVQGMLLAYFNGVLTTLEKVFGIRSSMMGLILAGNDISQILVGLIINHFGNLGSRPFWLSIGMLTTGASCLMYAATHLLWRSQVYYGSNGEQVDTEGYHESFCAAETDSLTYSTSIDVVTQTALAAVTDIVSSISLEKSVSRSDTLVLATLFIGQLISGIGSTTLFSFGYTYMDDSIKKSSSPLYTGLTLGLRFFGKILGFFLVSFCLALNVHLTERSRHSESDPLFIGCWWLGFIILGFLQLIMVFPMILFPKKLQSEKLLECKEVYKEPESVTSVWKDFWESLVRVLRVPVVVCYTISIGPYVFGMIGSIIFTPKYLEAQFGQTPGNASIFSGVSGMSMVMVGSIVGGIVIWKYQPRALYVNSFCVLSDVLQIVCTIFLMTLDCGDEKFEGVQLFDHGRFNVTSDCSRGCSCEIEFDPVCVGTTNFLSPCFAGCTALDDNDLDGRTFLNCICAAPNVSGSASASFLSELNNASWSIGHRGYCPGGRSECSYLWLYSIVKGISMLIGSATRIIFILVLVRSVEKRDKSLVLALTMVASSLTGLIPSPIAFGAAIDNTCSLWNIDSDGQRGNCWIYDTQAFSYSFHNLQIICFAITAFMGLFVCYYGNVNLYDDNVNHNNNDLSNYNKDDNNKDNTGNNNNDNNNNYNNYNDDDDDNGNHNNVETVSRKQMNGFRRQEVSSVTYL